MSIPHVAGRRSTHLRPPSTQTPTSIVNPRFEKFEPYCCTFEVGLDLTEFFNTHCPEFTTNWTAGIFTVTEINKTEPHLNNKEN